MEDFLDGIHTLLKGELFEASLKILLDCPSDIQIRGDRKMLEQVLINLVKNSIDSTSSVENASIELSAHSITEGPVSIRVKDNGHGIPVDVLPNIFVPFFTTRESGTGIGLSLSRQIMDLHNGKISAYSIPEKETVFNLIFPK